MRHLYSIWFGGILVAVLVFALAMVESLASVSPLRFDEDGLPLVTSNPLTTLGVIAGWFVVGLVYPIWLGFMSDSRLRDVFVVVNAAATTGITTASLVCFLLSLCVQSHTSSCLVWLLASGFVAARVWQAGLRTP